MNSIVQQLGSPPLVTSFTGTYAQPDNYVYNKKGVAYVIGNCKLSDVTSTTYYIDSTNGADTNPGTFASPVKTTIALQKLVDAYGGGGVLGIYFKAGTYSTPRSFGFALNGWGDSPNPPTWTESTKTLRLSKQFASYNHTNENNNGTNWIKITGGTGVTPGWYQITGKTSDDAITLGTSLSASHVDLGTGAGITGSPACLLDINIPMRVSCDPGVVCTHFTNNIYYSFTFSGALKSTWVAAGGTGYTVATSLTFSNGADWYGRN